MNDLRDILFRDLGKCWASAVIYADDAGVLAGADDARAAADELDVQIRYLSHDGAAVRPGDAVMRFSGTPKQVVQAEDVLMGWLSKPSGVATAAARFVEVAERASAGALPRASSAERARRPCAT